MKSVPELMEELEDEQAVMEEMQQKIRALGSNLDVSDHLNILHSRIDSALTFIGAQSGPEAMVAFQQFATFDRVAQAYQYMATKYGTNKLIVPK